MRRRALLSLAVLLLAAHTALAGEVQLKSSFGLGGAAKTGAWIPVSVEITYTPADPSSVIEGELRLYVPAAVESIVYAREVTLGQGKRRLCLYFPQELFQTGRLLSDSSMRVGLFDRDENKEIATSPITITPSNIYDQQTTFLCVLSESDRFPLGMLTVGSGGIGGEGFFDFDPTTMGRIPYRTQAVRVSAAHAPDAWVGWQSADVLLWEDPDLSPLQPQQRAAIEEWVWAGGILLVSFSSDREPVKAEGLPDWLPATIGAIEQQALADPNGWAQMPPSVMRLGAGAWQYMLYRKKKRTDLLHPQTGENAFRMPIRALSVTSGRAFPRDESRPLLVRGSYGAGTVAILGIDPGAWPFRVFLGTPSILSRAAGVLLDPRDAGLIIRQEPALDPEREAIRLGYYYDITNPQNAPVTNDAFYQMVALATLQPPSMQTIATGWLVLFLALYILMIGPVDYWLLRRSGRLHLTWITFGAYILVFGGIAFFGSRYLRENRTVSKGYALVDHVAGQKRQSRQALSGIFSPRRVVADVTGQGWMRPVSRDVYQVSRLSRIDRSALMTGDEMQPEFTALHEDTPMVAKDVLFSQDSTRRFRTESIAPGSAVIEGDLHYEGNELKGSFRVTGKQTLRNVTLVGRYGVYEIGDLAPGAAWNAEGKPTRALLMYLAELGLGDLTSGEEVDPKVQARRNLRRLSLASFIQHWRKIEPLARMQAEQPRWIERNEWEVSDFPSRADADDPLAGGSEKPKALPHLLQGYSLEQLWRVRPLPMQRMDWSPQILRGGLILFANTDSAPEEVRVPGWLLVRQGGTAHRVLFPPHARAAGGALWRDPFYTRQPLTTKRSVEP